MIGSAWTPDKIGFVACYPNVARAGMASLGMHVITRIAGEHPRFIADTCFMPEKPAGSRLASTRIGAPLASFSLVGFSCPFEPDYPNVAWMLRAAGIPVTAAARTEARARGDQVPVVIAGGIAVSSNPLPVLPLFDFIFMLDSELSFRRFLDDFPRFLEDDHASSASGIDAWWQSFGGSRLGIVPAFKYRAGEDVPWGIIFSPEACKVDQPGLDGAAAIIDQALADPDDTDAALGTSFLLEIGRGCGEGCRFCLVGSRLRPPRIASDAAIAAQVVSIKDARLPCKKIALIATNVADHPGLAAACDCILDAGLQVSIPSTKPVSDARLLGMIKRSGIKTITIAPETGSDTLRAAANKKVTTEKYESATVALLDAGVSTIKIYMLFGLPFETPGDLDRTIEFLERLRDHVLGHGARLAVTINPFIPKLGTPFMFHVDNYLSENIKAFKQRYGEFARRAEKAIRARVDIMSIKEARVQAVLSLGGIEIAQHVTRVPFAIPDDAADRVLRGTRDMQLMAAFPAPLDRIVPVPLSFLKREWERALAGITSPRCDPPASCAACEHVSCNTWASTKKQG